MIFHIFGPDVFESLEDLHGNAIGCSPQDLIQHLKDKYVTSQQKKYQIAHLEEELQLKAQSVVATPVPTTDSTEVTWMKAQLAAAKMNTKNKKQCQAHNLPRGEQFVCRYLGNSNYCHTCGFDVKHSRGTVNTREQPH